MRVRKYANKFLNKFRGGVDTPLFLWYNILICNLNMDRDKLKLVVKDLKSLVNVLESEVYSDTSAYNISQDDADKSNYEDGDDDGYPY